MKYIIVSSMLLATLASALPAAAQEIKQEMKQKMKTDAMHHEASVAAQSDAAPKVNGEIRKVDADAGKVTIRHGEIPNLEMPGMTMVFRVASPDMLSKIKAGDQVLFTAEKNNGALTVTSIELIPPK